MHSPTSLLFFFLYAIDKKRAGTTVCGGFPSLPSFWLRFIVGSFRGCGAMRLLRHKTQKIKFRLVPIFLILHIAILYIAARVLHVIA